MLTFLFLFIEGFPQVRLITPRAESRCTLSWRSWAHPWDTCHTATSCAHWRCFSVCTICGQWTTCKIHFSQHLVFYFLRVGRGSRSISYLVSLTSCLNMSGGPQVYLACNKLSIFNSRTYIWSKKYFTIDELMMVNLVFSFWVGI